LYSVLGANVGYDMPELDPDNGYAAVKADVARALKGDFGRYSIHREYMPIEYDGEHVTARHQDFDIYIPADLPFGKEAYVLAHEFAEAENLRKSGGNRLSAEQHITFETYVLNALNELRLEGNVTAAFAYQAAQDMRESLKPDVGRDAREFYTQSWNGHRALNRMGMYRN